MIETGRPEALLPLALFMVLMLGVSFFVRWQARTGEGGFLRQYFVGNRDLGGFVLAMTTVATYSSVSSFVGGPGMAWSVGFGWIYMAVVQVTAVFLVLGIFGKRVALLARKFSAVTVVDILRRRFRSDALAATAAFIIVGCPPSANTTRWGCIRAVSCNLRVSFVSCPSSCMSPFL